MQQRARKSSATGDERTPVHNETRRGARQPGMQPPSLPIQLTSFIGRQSEVKELLTFFGEQRLVALTGPGGVGKTRLAIEVARRLAQRFEDGVWLVELASFADARLVPQAVATALGVREEPGRTLEVTLTERLQPRRLLLVLDTASTWSAHALS